MPQINEPRYLQGTGTILRNVTRNVDLPCDDLTLPEFMVEDVVVTRLDVQTPAHGFGMEKRVPGRIQKLSPLTGNLFWDPDQIDPREWVAKLEDYEVLFPLQPGEKEPSRAAFEGYLVLGQVAVNKDAQLMAPFTLRIDGAWIYTAAVRA